MCGIAGFVGLRDNSSEIALRKMLSCLTHRGPDDEGIWISEDAEIALGHRRLAILDLSPAGRQPMRSHCGRYVIAFNGEIYNWPELKAELERSGKNPTWQGTSDTEIFLAAISAWGLGASLKRSRGMFAFALWDSKKNKLSLVRDRIGEKPLYYGLINGQFLFASELKSISALFGKKLEQNPDSLALMLRYGYVPEPHSIYNNIFKLPPGTMISFSSKRKLGDVETYWSFGDFVYAQKQNLLDVNDEQAIDGLENLLRLAIKEQMVADVPLGAFLSGGIDSSAIVAVMQAQSQQPVKTFTIGYNESDYNEAHHARKIAKHLGTEHTELFISAEQCLDVIPSLPKFYDEPFADVSQIPTVLISKLTKNYVNVCLSGDAGDELFGGYNRYFWAETIWKWMAGIPSPIRQPLSSVLNSMPVNAVNRIYSCFQPMLPNTYKVNNLGDKLHKIGQILPAASKDELYHYLVSQWRGNLPLQNVTEPSTFLSEPNKWLKLESYPERMMSVDTQTYLPQDILVKLDRASMAASLETRVPFLDLRIMEFAWQLPLNQKIRNGEGKWLVRKLLSRYIPEKLWNRPKQGFAVPIEHWLRGPLRDWAEDLLSSKKLAEDGFLDPIPIRQVWDRHLSGENMQYALWNILTYRAWSEKWR